MFKARFLGYIREFAVTEIVEQVARAIGGGADEKEIGFAVAVVIEEAGAGARTDWRGRGCCLFNYFGYWARCETNGNCSGSVFRRAAREFGEREAALIAVGRAEGSAEMLGRYFLEFGEMLAGGGGVAAALISAGEAKFGGGMVRKEGESFLKGGDGLVVMLKLRIEIADEIPRVGFVGDLGDVGESLDAFFGIAEILVDETEVVPSEGISRKFFSGCSESGASRFELLLREERDAEIETRNFELRIGDERFFEKFLCVGGALLVHVGDAKRVETIGFGGIGMRRGFLRGCGLRWVRARTQKTRAERPGVKESGHSEKKCVTRE